MIKVYGNKIFHLSDGKFSYAFYIEDGNLYHSYYGRALSIDGAHAEKSVLAGDGHKGNDWASFEIGEQGRGDYRIPSVVLRSSGMTATDFKYVSHKIIKKPDIGMPAMRGDAETLMVVLRDNAAHAELVLYYSVYDGALVRHAEVVNLSGEAVTLCVLDSACTELPMGEYDCVSIGGRWGQECVVDRSAVAPGIRKISSTRGFSSHQHNPFAAVVSKDCTEDSGEVYAVSLIYSGNFAIRLERDEKSQLRFNAGIELMEGGIMLAPGEKFVSPEAVSVYTCHGLGDMSRCYHRLFRKHLIDPRFADKIRPIVVNSWESVYFDFDESKILEFIDGAKGLGIDTVVLDDGWFGHRDCDNSSLGDWYVDKRKLPNGLKPLIDRCKSNGMKFGIWFEPEAISRDSDLYCAHPDWAIASDGRDAIEMRNQLVLDFSKPEAVDFIFKSMSKILGEYDISYVKWDANRYIADIPDTKKYIGCISGLYDLYRRLSEKFPDTLIEGCASGGGRFDPAILYYSPMIWASDDSDAVERTKIQYGLSLVYPLQTMSNHVSTCPNHQSGRLTPFATRGAVASLGCLGYELNIAKLDASERSQIKDQVEAYRRDAELIINGELYRLCNPLCDGAFCEQVTSADGKKAYVVFVRMLNTVNLPLKKIKLKGLREDALYTVKERNAVYTGAELMYAGIMPHAENDFGSEVLHVEMQR